MNKAIIGKKLGMTQVFTPEGIVIPVTVVQATPNIVLQKKTVEIDGYSAVQLGFLDKKDKVITKPVLGHCKKAGTSGKRYIKEFQLKNCDAFKIGDQVKVDIFAEGEVVDVTGVTKGRGFAGAIERHGQHRMFETHGTGPCVRQSGSMGAGTTPARVMKNRPMPGHLGTEQVTMLNLKVIKVDKEKNLLLIKGAIPGSAGSAVYVRSAIKTQRVIKPQKVKAKK